MCISVEAVEKGNSMMQMKHKLSTFGTNVMCEFSGHKDMLQILCFISSLCT